MATSVHWPLSPNKSLNNLSAVRGQDHALLPLSHENYKGK